MRASSQHGLSALARHSAWVAGQLVVSLEDCLVFDAGVPLRTLALEYLTGSQLWRAPKAIWPRLVGEIEGIAFAEGAPLCSFTAVDTAQVEKRHWNGELKNAAFALRLRSLREPIVVLAQEAVVPNHSGSRAEQQQWIAVRRDAVAETLRFFHRALTNGRKRVRVFGGEDYFLPSQEERPYSWDDVLLDEARQALVRRDFEHFLERRDWFAARRVPWRRGYLFHGPPGNGKTSAVRAMASHPRTSAFSIDFADKDTSDYDVSRLFEAAADHSPGLILLEDFDRVFTKAQDGEERHCSYSHLLNCLDGLSGREGTIVVATANHPELLDEAILRRPGRFDRVVHFPAPDLRMRERYLESLCPGLRGKLTALAVASERMSFAQLKEVWLLASQSVVDLEGEASLAGLEEAMTQVKREQSLSSRGKLGFEIPLDENPGEFSPVAATMQL